MRELSADALREMSHAETGEVFAVLLTVTHADLPGGAVYVTTELGGVTQGGNDFLPFAFILEFPTAPDGVTYTTRLALDGASADRAIAEALLQTQDAPMVQIQLIRLSDPDNPEIVFPPMKWDHIQITATRIEGELSMVAQLADEPFPGWTYTPYNHPNLFATVT